jgi:hypothetical protein
MEILSIITLALSGLLLFFVGTMRLMNPINTYLKNSGIKLEKDVNLLNEMRGVSSVMLIAGAFILLGIFFPQIGILSHAFAILLFMGFALGRIISLVLDGKPNKLITQGLVFELVFFGLNSFCLIQIYLL